MRRFVPFCVVMLLVAVGLGGASVAARAQPTLGHRAAAPLLAASTPCPAPTDAATETLARRFVTERMSNPAVLGELLAPEVDYHRALTTDVLTADEATALMEVTQDAFPDVQVTVDRVVVAGDMATVIWTADATHLGELAPWNAPATGKAATWEGISVVRVACGRIAEVWNQIDYLSLLVQLGIISDTELRDIAPAGTPAP